MLSGACCTFICTVWHSPCYGTYNLINIPNWMSYTFANKYVHTIDIIYVYGMTVRNNTILFWFTGWPQRRRRRLRRCSSRRGPAQLIEWGVRARRAARGPPRCSCSRRRTPSVDTRGLLSSGHILFYIYTCTQVFVHFIKKIRSCYCELAASKLIIFTCNKRSQDWTAIKIEIRS